MATKRFLITHFNFAYYSLFPIHLGLKQQLHSYTHITPLKSRHNSIPKCHFQTIYGTKTTPFGVAHNLCMHKWLRVRELATLSHNPTLCCCLLESSQQSAVSSLVFVKMISFSPWIQNCHCSSDNTAPVSTLNIVRLIPKPTINLVKTRAEEKELKPGLWGASDKP